MTILFYNNATTTLSAPVGLTDLTIQLATGSGTLFTPGPTGSDYFCVTLSTASTGLSNEIVHCTNVSGDVLTVVRGQEGTVAQTWLIGDTVENRVTAAALENIQYSPSPSAAVWTTARTFTFTGDVTGSLGPVNGSTNLSTPLTCGNAAQAAKWTTARTLTFTGDVTGSGSVDGSGNVSFAMTGVQAAKLTNARTIAATGQVVWSVSFDGSSNVTAVAALGTGAAVANIGYTPLNRASNLSDVVSVPTARVNLGIQTYKSSSFTPTNGSANTLSHGLTINTGMIVTVFMEYTCTTTEGGWAVGDVVTVNSNTLGSGNDHGVTTAYNNSSVKYSISNNGVYATTYTSPGNFTFTPSSWSAKVVMSAIG
jgi:hypothetical protein